MCEYEEQMLPGMDEDELRDAISEQAQWEEDGIGGDF
jgi:hypothetical protein